MLGKRLSAESRIKISAAGQGRVFSEESKLKSRLSNIGQHRSEETKKRLKEAWVGRKQKFKQRSGYHLSEEHKRRLRELHLGKPAWNKGMPHSEETKRKIRERLGRGNRNVNWKGGKRASQRRVVSRRRALGFIPLNQDFENSEAHHIDKEHVIYIPKSLHRSVWHSLSNLDTMERINTKVFCWILGGNVL